MRGHSRFAALFLIAAVGTLVTAQDAKTPAHVMLTPADVKWGEQPPALPKGATFVVVSGDPGKPGPFAIRLKMPAGYKIAAHWHPTDEHVTVLACKYAAWTVSSQTSLHSPALCRLHALVRLLTQAAQPGIPTQAPY